MRVGSGGRRRGSGHASMREIPDNRAQLPLRGGGEHGVEPLVELLERQPALSVVLAQERSGGLAV
jgi:hypothetical protein